MKMKACFVLALLLTLPHAASAMCVTNSFKLLAWNAGGTAALVRIDRSGPEGGGSEAYALVDFKAGQKSDYVFSSDFSPGGSSTPESISSAACKESEAGLNNNLKEHGFTSRLTNTCSSSQRASSFAFHDAALREMDAASALRIDPNSPIPAKTIFASTPNGANNGSHIIRIKNNNSCDARCEIFLHDNGKYTPIGACG